VRLFVPRSAVIATDVFDDFMETNELSGFALREEDDGVILGRVLTGRLPPQAIDELTAFLARARYPLAVRSSSLLEDSRHLPAAGIYPTHMLPNDDPDDGVRLGQLLFAIKHIYASTFFRNAKAYLAGTPGRVEDEKMAIVLQQIVGRRHGRYVYPDMAGVASSHNYYPVGRIRPEDGVAVVAMGLGRTVVEGGRAVRFSPAHPEWLPQFSSVDDILANAQREFWALDTRAALDFSTELGADNLVHLGLEAAREHGGLRHLGSVYSPENHAIYDGSGRPGIPLVTMAPILKGRRFPLAAAIRLLLGIGVAGMSGPVEIEFAANLPAAGASDDDHGEFGFLQIRPQVLHQAVETDLSALERDRILVGPCRALGAGRESGIYDILAVSPDGFDRSRTEAVAMDVGRANAALANEGRPYILVGPGRWGTADRWLGIPVSWDQIARARAIVECPLDGVSIEPSDGAHFFHNITTRGMAYFTIGGRHGGTVDWDWLRDRTTTQWGSVSHVRVAEPFEIWVNGREGLGAILKGTPGGGFGG
jgi:hypothetical protein